MPVKKSTAKKAAGIQRDKAASIMADINTTLKLEKGITVGSDPYFDIIRIPTGSLVLDRITGGGFALGRHYELFGDESAGKSYIAYRTMALAQSRGNLCAIIDPEHSFDGERFAFLGGDPEALLAFHPEDAEDAVAVMMLLAKKAKELREITDGPQLEVVTIDSVSSLVPGEEMERDPRDEDRMAAQARMMSRALRRITTVNERVLFLWTNQERTNVGVRFGSPKTTSGGKALRFYATGRIEFRKGGKMLGKRPVARAGKLVETEVAVGRWTQVRVEKDKSTIPNREGAFFFDYEMKKIDSSWEIISLGLEDGIVHRTSNGIYSYVDLDDKEWKGFEKKFRKLLRDNPGMRGEIEDVIEDNTRNHTFGGEDDSED